MLNSIIGGLLIVGGIAMRVAWKSMVDAARQVDNPVNWPVLPTIPKPSQVPAAPPATKQTPKATSGVEAWYRYRDELLAKGATPEEIEAMADKSWKYLLLEAPVKDA